MHQMTSCQHSPLIEVYNRFKSPNDCKGNGKTYLSENSMGVSPGRMFWGSRYHTSHTTAQEVINRIKCMVNDCLHKTTTSIFMTLVTIWWKGTFFFSCHGLRLCDRSVRNELWQVSHIDETELVANQIYGQYAVSLALWKSFPEKAYKSKKGVSFL